ncbi:MAG: helix-turn-helix transcriptional regulator [Lentisphaeria bacterium]|nr:helix-turn-helix transcriptional regulator [Lentisphaeria bacterium]
METKCNKIICLDNLRPREQFPVRIRDTYQAESAEPHSHDYIEVALVHNGRGTHRNHLPDGKVIANTIIKGDIFVMLPGDVHSYANCRGYQVYNLCIGVDFFNSLDPELQKLKFYRQFFLPERQAEMNQLHLLPARFSTAEEKLRRLSMAMRSDSASCLLAVRLALTDFLYTVFDSGPGSSQQLDSGMNYRLSQSIIQMEANPEKKFDLKTIARQAGMSSSGFSHKFKQATGVAPGDYCLFLKLDKVRKLLENKALSLTEVALACGFSDSNYMIRSFKKRFGITPGNYRANILQISR